MADCRHAILKIEYLENENGSVEISFCNSCSKAIQVVCEHKKNKWVYTRNEANPEEQKLICELCGADGT